MLPDLLRPRLWIVFVGTSVGERSAQAGHYYADSTNRFWQLLEATGLTEGAGITSERDAELLDHAIGITDLVKARAASSDSRLEAGDYDVPGFLDRIEANRPTILAFNGRESARRLARHVGEPVPDEGPLPWKIAGALGYRLPSSSGANARSPGEKTEAWRQFGSWARDRRSDARAPSSSVHESVAGPPAQSGSGR